MGLMFDKYDGSASVKFIKQLDQKQLRYRGVFYIDHVLCNFCPYCGIKINIEKIEE